MAIVGKIFSTLGNSQSLVPLAIKDCANGAGATAASAVTSKDEAKDRFMDEFGSEAIWLGGIPLFKTLTDKTLFQALKFDSKYDVRNLANKDIYKKTLEYAPTKEIKQNIERIGNNTKTFKNLNIAKFIVSTSLALGSYNLLTNLKQKYTENRIRTKLLKEREKQSKLKMATNENLLANEDKNFENLAKIRNHENDKKGDDKTSFKGLQSFMLDPVKNMFVMDAGITSQRILKSRSPQECIGYTIKESGFLFFMYVLGEKVQQHFENVADKKHNKSIALDSKVLENDNFKESFKNGTIVDDLKNFADADKGDGSLYDFIKSETDKGITKEHKNGVIDVATQSDIVQTYKKPKKWYQIFKKAEDTQMLDTRKYIDLKKVRETHSNISKLYNQFEQSGQTIDEFFNGVRKLKRGSIIKNMGSTILALGLVLPSIMLADRLCRGNNKEFAVEKRIKNELNAQG